MTRSLVTAANRPKTAKSKNRVSGAQNDSPRKHVLQTFHIKTNYLRCNLFGIKIFSLLHSTGLSEFLKKWQIHTNRRPWPLNSTPYETRKPNCPDKPARRLRKICMAYVRPVGVVVSCIASLLIDSVPMVYYYVLYSNCVCKMRRFGDTRLLKLP